MSAPVRKGNRARHLPLCVYWTDRQAVPCASVCARGCMHARAYSYALIGPNTYTHREAWWHAHVGIPTRGWLHRHIHAWRSAVVYVHMQMHAAVHAYLHVLAYILAYIYISIYIRMYGRIEHRASVSAPHRRKRCIPRTTTSLGRCSTRRCSR